MPIFSEPLTKSAVLQRVSFLDSQCSATHPVPIPCQLVHMPGRIHKPHPIPSTLTAGASCPCTSWLMSFVFVRFLVSALLNLASTSTGKSVGSRALLTANLNNSSADKSNSQPQPKSPSPSPSLFFRSPFGRATTAKRALLDWGRPVNLVQTGPRPTPRASLLRFPTPTLIQVAPAFAPDEAAEGCDAQPSTSTLNFLNLQHQPSAIRILAI